MPTQNNLLGCPACRQRHFKRQSRALCKGGQKVGHCVHEDRPHEGRVGDESVGAAGIFGQLTQQRAVQAVAEAEGVHRARQPVLVAVAPQHGQVAPGGDHVRQAVSQQQHRARPAHHAHADAADAAARGSPPRPLRLAEELEARVQPVPQARLAPRTQGLHCEPGGLLACLVGSGQLKGHPRGRAEGYKPHSVVLIQGTNNSLECMLHNVQQGEAMGLGICFFGGLHCCSRVHGSAHINHANNIHWSAVSACWGAHHDRTDPIICLFELKGNFLVTECFRHNSVY
mmetsp:Transcript_33359/g.58086  ORF Transcript_33359/g.58086 Transcript_33359/m.58086 type:complete len:285 (-) Transcript_33359:424-1278(-)